MTPEQQAAYREKKNAVWREWCSKNRESVNARNKAWRDSNPEIIAARQKLWAERYNRKAESIAKRKAYYQKTKKMTITLHRIRKQARNGWIGDAFEVALSEQEGRCAICRKRFFGENEVKADHDHNTGKRRELLCHFCNTQLGIFEKNRELFEVKFPEYLRRWSS